MLLANAFEGNSNTSQAIGTENRLEAQQTREDTESPKYEYQEALNAQHGAQEIPTAFARMLSLMEEGHPETIRFGLRDNPLTREFIRNANDATFTKALQFLDADSMFGEYKTVHSCIKHSLTKMPFFRFVRKIEERMDDFASDLDCIWQLRRNAGHKLGLDACKVFLRAAAVMGDAPRAVHVFDAIMPEDGVQPDVECFNLLMEALCWNHAFTQSERGELRVTALRLHVRRAENRFPPLCLSGHKVDLKSSKKPGLRVGVRFKVLTVFRKLVAAGVQGDEATFTNVMVGMSREGDLSGVKSILKSVWNVDVDMLSAYDEEEIEGPTFYQEGSPLRPSSRLLFTIAHVFGSNNQAAAAFGLIDYVSRNYNLPIAPAVWRELCVWTRVLSSRPTPTRLRQGNAEGQIFWKVFENLWQIMTDEPHNLVPDVWFMSLRSDNFHSARLLDRTVDSCRHMKALLAKTNEKVVALFWEMMNLMKNLQDLDVERPLSVDFLDKRHEYILASQEYERDLQLLVVSIRRIFEEDQWAGAGKEYEWASRRLPVILSELAEHAPNEVIYRTPTGHIQFDFKTDRKISWRKSRMLPASRFHDATWLGIMRQMLDHDDHELVWWRIKTMLPGGFVRTALENGSSDALMQVVTEMLGQSVEQLRIAWRLGLQERPLQP